MRRARLKVAPNIGSLSRGPKNESSESQLIPFNSENEEATKPNDSSDSAQIGETNADNVTIEPPKPTELPVEAAGKNSALLQKLSRLKARPNVSIPVRGAPSTVVVPPPSDSVAAESGPVNSSNDSISSSIRIETVFSLNEEAVASKPVSSNIINVVDPSRDTPTSNPERSLDFSPEPSHAFDSTAKASSQKNKTVNPFCCTCDARRRQTGGPKAFFNSAVIFNS